MQRQHRSACKRRAVDDQRAAIVRKLFVRSTPRRTSIPGLNFDRMDFLVGDRGDVLWRDAAIDDALLVFVKVEVINERGLIVDAGHFGAVNAIAPRMRVAEIFRGHKGEGTCV